MVSGKGNVVSAKGNVVSAKGNQEFTSKAGSAVEPAADPAIFGQGVDPNFGVVDPNFGVVFVLRFSNFTRPCYTPYSQAASIEINLTNAVEFLECEKVLCKFLCQA